MGGVVNMVRSTDLVNDINRITQNLKSVEILFISRHTQKGEFVYEAHYPALGQNINDQLIAAIITPMCENIKDMDVECYDPTVNSDSSVQIIRLTQVKEAEKIITKLNEVHSSEGFSIQEIDNGHLIGYCIKITNYEDKAAYLFKKLTNSKLLEKKKFWCFYMGSTLEKMTSQPLVIDERIDCFVCEDQICILNTYFFEVLFKINDEYRRKVDGILKEIEKTNIIAHMESFAVECKGSKAAQRRLIKIASSNYIALNLLARDVDKMNSLIEEHNLLLDVSADGKIIYNEGDAVEPILRLIDGGLITMDVYGTKGHALKLSPPLE